MEPRWLDDDEMATWLPLLRVVQLLPQALDRQLREQTGINHVYWTLLAVLSYGETSTRDLSADQAVALRNAGAVERV